VVNAPPVPPERASWRETVILTALAAALIAFLSRKGLTTYFFSEAFVYLGSYREAGNSFVGALLRPHSQIFFRPSVWAVNLAWNLAAPPDPLLYHLRNLCFIVLDALLFHRLLLRLIPGASARTIGILFFAVSKVHLTTIGYAALFSTILLLTATLSMLVAFCRYQERGRTIDFVATLFCAAFVIFAKEYGMAAVLLLPLLAHARGTNGLRTVRRFAVPVAVLIGVFLGLRAWIGPVRHDGVYAPRLEARVAINKLKTLTATLANMSLDEDSGIQGSRGITRVVWPEWTAEGEMTERAILLALIIALLTLLWRTRLPVSMLAFCIAWGILMFAPTLLTRNIQLYYLNDSVAAFAVLMAALFQRATPAARRMVVGALLLIALNAEWSQKRMSYIWYTMAERTRPVAELARTYRSTEHSRVVFVTSELDYWKFALRADATGAFVQELFGRPDLEVLVIGRGEPIPPDSLAVDADREMTVIAAPTQR
jgi:hypothetical protein